MASIPNYSAPKGSVAEGSHKANPAFLRRSEKISPS
jgi:hypothetical protein